MTRIFIAIWLIFPIFIGCDKVINSDPEPGPPWMQFTRESTGGGLVNNRINSIFVDAGNKKWFATDGGASSFLRGRWTTYTAEVQFSVYSQTGTTISRKVLSITQGFGGSMWFGLGGGGVRRYFSVGGSQPWRSYTSAHGLSSNTVYAMSADRFGDIWCATTYGASRFKPSTVDQNEGTWTPYFPSEYTLPTGFIRSVSIDNITNTIWFGTLYGELVSFDGMNLWIAHTAPNGASPVASIAADNNNVMWIGTDDGAFSYNPNAAWTHYDTVTTRGGLPSNFVQCVVIDFKGNRWFGTNQGLARFDGSVWTHYHRATIPELPSDTITALAIDVDKNLWIGTPKGVAAFNENGVR